MGWKLFVSVADFSDPVMHEVFFQIERAVYTLPLQMERIKIKRQMTECCYPGRAEEQVVK